MTGVAPADLMFKARKFGTNLPQVKVSVPSPQEQKARATDAERKMKMKRYADRNSRELHIKPGDRVLLKQKKLNKLTLAYEPEPYTVLEVKGSQVTAQNHIHPVTRHVNMLKKLSSGSESGLLIEDEPEHEIGQAAPEDYPSSPTTEAITGQPVPPRPTIHLPSPTHTPSGQVVPQPMTFPAALDHLQSQQATELSARDTDPLSSTAPPSDAPGTSTRRSQRQNRQMPVRYRDTDWTV